MSHLSHCINDAMKEGLFAEKNNPAILLKNLKRVEEEARDTKHRALILTENKKE